MKNALLSRKTHNPLSDTEKRIVIKDWTRIPSLAEIEAVQGGPKICTNIDDYFGFLADFWNSPEEVEDFLERRKREI